MKSNISINVAVPTETQLSFLNALTEVLKAFEGELGSFSVYIHDTDEKVEADW